MVQGWHLMMGKEMGQGKAMDWGLLEMTQGKAARHTGLEGE